MALDDERCCFCRHEILIRGWADRPGWREVECPVCGLYRIELQFWVAAHFKKARQPVLYRGLARWLAERRDRGQPPEIPFEGWETVAGPFTDLTPKPKEEPTMSDRNAAFVGRIPENYDRYLGPVFFHPYADDLANRLESAPGMQVLEVACGTGLLTRRLLARIHGQGSLVATDLNDAMIAHGRTRLPADPGLQWRQADATHLPFPDGSFDAVMCQFGLMFFPDKVAGMREAFRVLKPGGRYLFNVWDSFAHNPIGRITHETVAECFETDPPQFYAVPFGYHDPTVIRSHLDQVGFDPVHWEYVEKVGTSPSAEDVAIGLIEGNPIFGAIMERRPEALPDIKKRVAARLAGALGDRPLRCGLRALVFSAQRPSR